MAEPCGIAVVGAGAAGLIAAIAAAETVRSVSTGASGGGRVVLIERMRRLGAKILVSGGGRCNVTHARVAAEDYNGSRRIVRRVLDAFDVPRTISWFASIGVELEQEETGKLFPASGRARTVLEALITRARKLGVEILPGAFVREVHLEVGGAEGGGEVFRLVTGAGDLWTRRLILATGGRCLPRTGSDGSGFDLARSLGHAVTEIHPALVPLVLERGMFHARLAGISLPVELTVLAGGRRIDRRCGELLWTHFGVSGPVVLDASRHWTVTRASGAEVELRCAFLPPLRFEQVDAWLLEAARSWPRRGLRRIIASRIPGRLAEEILARERIEGHRPAGHLTRQERRRLAEALTAFRLPVLRPRGWNDAEVTAGGVPLEEIDAHTMESRKVPGLYLVGEMLDCDGRVGGFNFQWAWSTGWVAGRAAARRRSGTGRRP